MTVMTFTDNDVRSWPPTQSSSCEKKIGLEMIFFAYINHYLCVCLIMYKETSTRKKYRSLSFTLNFYYQKYNKKFFRGVNLVYFIVYATQLVTELGGCVDGRDHVGLNFDQMPSLDLGFKYFFLNISSYIDLEHYFCVSLNQ